MTIFPHILPVSYDIYEHRELGIAWTMEHRQMCMISHVLVEDNDDVAYDSQDSNRIARLDALG